MDWRELLSSLQDKLTSDEKEYLAAHRLQDILADETRFCDDPATARLICRRVMYDQLLQAIQLTRKCPGVLTSVMYLTTYEYMAQNLRGCVRGQCGCVPAASRIALLPQETGKQLVFILYKGGAPLFFRDAAGMWYGAISCVKPRKARSIDAYHMLHSPYKETNYCSISYSAAEACFMNNIMNYEDWPAFRKERTKANIKACYRRKRERKSPVLRILKELEKEITDEDKRLINRWRLDDYISAVVAAQQNSTIEHKHAVYKDLVEHIITATILLSNRVPGLLTTYIRLYMMAKINHLESGHQSSDAGWHGFRAGYASHSTHLREPGAKVCFCLRHHGEPVLFRGEDGKWYTATRRVEPSLHSTGIGYIVYTGAPARNLFLSKSRIDLCYRYNHDEYTTWKEIKKAGCLDAGEKIIRKRRRK